jgi:hypothetical protein
VLKGHQECLECQVGRFTDAEEQATCKHCPGGYFASSTRAIACDGCGIGTFSNTGASACIDCAKGKYENTPFSSGCKNCAAGQITTQTGQSTCVNCAVGKYQDQEGKSNCKSCPAGRFAGVTGLPSCKACKKGQISAEGASSCTVCADGQYQDQTGQASCKGCPTNTGTVTTIEYPRVTSGTCESNGYDTIDTKELCKSQGVIRTKWFGSDIMEWNTGLSPLSWWADLQWWDYTEPEMPHGCVYGGYPRAATRNYFKSGTNSNQCDARWDYQNLRTQSGGCICKEELPGAACKTCEEGTHLDSGACKECQTGKYLQSGTCTDCSLPNWGTVSETLFGTTTTYSYSGWTGDFEHGTMTKYNEVGGQQVCVAYQPCPTSSSDRYKVEECSVLFSTTFISSGYRAFDFLENIDTGNKVWSMCCYVHGGQNCPSLYTTGNWNSGLTGNFNRIIYNGKILCDPTGVFDGDLV